MRRTVLVAGLVMAVAALPAMAAGDEIFRSDLPLWQESDEGVAPWVCGDLARCTDFDMGVWERVGEDWISFQIAGPIHGTFRIARAAQEAGLKDAMTDNAVMVFLGSSPSGERLYALQIGFRGGSGYWLLQAVPVKDHPIRKFKVLDARCDDGGKARRLDPLGGSYRTDYCAVPTRAALKKIARAALGREALTTLEWRRDPEDEKKP